MKPEEEILKFKSGEKVIYTDRCFDNRINKLEYNNDVRKVISENCIDIIESFNFIDGAYTLRISGIKK